MKIFSILLNSIIIILLTALTQTGGLLYLLSLTAYGYINRKFSNKWIKGMVKCFSFFLLYFISTFLVVPPIAKYFGRVQLPLSSTGNVKPLNFLTCLLNRNYVTPELKTALFNVADEMNKKYPGTVINYLDANFPFIKGFALLPHLSHNDGKKLDISFCYIDKKTGLQTNQCPSFIGYGICEEPTATEQQMAAICKAKGYWQYDFLRTITPQNNKAYFFMGCRPH